MTDNDSTNDNNGEYVSNPRLALLAEELRILNEDMIKTGVSDHRRLARLRDFAESSKHVTNITLPALERVANGNDDDWYTASIRGKSVGIFANPVQVFAAYRIAHVKLYGIESQYHPDCRVDTSHLHHEDELPQGISLTTEGRFRARIVVEGRTKTIGVSDTLGEAVEAYAAAKHQDPAAYRREFTSDQNQEETNHAFA